jgi:hypothetical protein
MLPARVQRAARCAAGWVIATVAVAAPAHADDVACPPATPADGPGSVDPFRAPAPEATALNAAALTLYRQGHWDEARAKYRAAEQADRDFLAPALNVACSFVRQERFGEATAEVLRLLGRAYVPWSREVLTAADLGALKVQPQMADVKRAMAEDARRWGAGLDNDLLFIARLREPLKLPPATDADGPVVLVLGLHQEVFAWSPVTDRYRQLTAEDGHVVAKVSSSDRRHLMYVTAEKLVRSPKGPATLRGVVLHVLMLPLMTVGKPIPIAGDVSRLGIAPAPSGFSVEIAGDRINGTFAQASDGGPMVPARPPDERHRKERVVLTAAGVAAGAPRALAAGEGCHLTARPSKSSEKSMDKSGQGPATIEILPAGRRAAAPPKTLRTRFGAGLDGLSIP